MPSTKPPDPPGHQSEVLIPQRANGILNPRASIDESVISESSCYTSTTDGDGDDGGSSFNKEGGNTRRTSADWEDMIHRKEEMKQHRHDAEIGVVVDDGAVGVREHRHQEDEEAENHKAVTVRVLPHVSTNQQSTEVTEEERYKRRKYLFIILAVLLLLTTVIGLVVGLIKNNGSGSNNVIGSKKDVASTADTITNTADTAPSIEATPDTFPSAEPDGCTEEEKQCPDGINWVMRNELSNCEFDPCPISELSVPSVSPTSIGSENMQSPSQSTTQPSTIECTPDLKTCPDGSFVARDPSDDCNFMSCNNSVASNTPSSSPTATPSSSEDNIPKQCTEVDSKICPDGITVVERNPFQNCEFFSCPNGVSSEVPSMMPTYSPVGLEFISVPTVQPVAQIQTTKPTPIVSPITMKPTTTSSISTQTTLLCTPSGDSEQCQGALTLLEQCSSSNSVENDQYGSAISILKSSDVRSDIYAVVGARYHSQSGVAYLLSYDKETNQWEHVAELRPSTNGNNADSSSYDQFGFAVAISSKWIAIGAPLDTAGTGSVAIYRLEDVLVSSANSNNSSISGAFRLIPQDSTYGSRVGSSVAIDDDMIVVGAARHQNKVGATYIYQHNDNGSWDEVANITPDDASDDSQGNFGYSVAIGNGVLVVGAPYNDDSGRNRCGSVYVYEQSSSGYGVLQKIVPPELLTGDQFGSAVAIGTMTNPSTNLKEERIVVGVYLDDDKGVDSGSVYIYVRRKNEGEFAFEQKLLATEWSLGNEFGGSVDIYEDRILVGSKKSDASGGAYLYRYDGNVWVESGKVTPNNGSSGDFFGSSVAMSLWDDRSTGGTTLQDVGVALVGSYLNDEMGEDSGSLYSYSVCDA